MPPLSVGEALEHREGSGIQLCNGHFLSDRSEGRSAVSHAVTKLGFTAKEHFFEENFSHRS